MSAHKQSSRRFTVYALVLGLVAPLLLSACNGGGGDGLPLPVEEGLEVPQNVQAYAGSEMVTIVWDEVDNAEHYTVYWDTAPGVSDNDNTLPTVTTTNAVHNGLTNGTTYYYRVAVTVNGREGALSDEQAATPTFWSTPATADEPVNALTWSGSRFVAVGNLGSVTISDDGAAWTSITAITAEALRGVAWGSGLFVTVGDGGTVETSADGTDGSWSANLQSADYDLHDVIWTGTRFVAVGRDLTGSEELVIHSTTPATNPWDRAATVPDTNNRLNAVAWSGTLLVAVGQNGLIITSADADSWTQRTSGTAEELRGVIWADDRFIAVGDNGTILSSTDGLSWTRQTVGVSPHFYDVFWDGGLYLAVGLNGAVLSSATGVTWTEEATPSVDFYTISGNVDLNVVAGEGGTIYTRPR